MNARHENATPIGRLAFPESEGSPIHSIVAALRPRFAQQQPRDLTVERIYSGPSPAAKSCATRAGVQTANSSAISVETAIAARFGSWIPRRESGAC